MDVEEEEEEEEKDDEENPSPPIRFDPNAPVASLCEGRGDKESPISSRPPSQ
jgi:hypothetical protein